MLQQKQNLKTFIDMIKTSDFVVLDTKTTGLNNGEICQIAVIDSAGKTLLDSFVKTIYTIPADATRIHGITDATVKDAPTWADLVMSVKALLTGRNVVVYNAVYDRKMMHQSAEKAGIEKIDWKEISTFWCAMEAYAEFYGEWNDYRQSYYWQKLSAAAQQCGVDVKNAHNALGDCLMTLGVVRAMARGE